MPRRRRRLFVDVLETRVFLSPSSSTSSRALTFARSRPGSTTVINLKQFLSTSSNIVSVKLSLSTPKSKKHENKTLFLSFFSLSLSLSSLSLFHPHSFSLFTPPPPPAS
jgi:hypothetical protein